jgi:hypothetical protein
VSDQCWGEVLHNVYSSPNVIRKNESRIMMWAGHVALMEALRNAQKKFLKNPGGKELLARLR